MLDAVELACIDRGAGDAVVLVHGGVFHAAPAWAKQLGPLVDAGFRVVAPDRRGHGRSPEGSAGFVPISLHVSDLSYTLGMREVSTPHLVGISYGALVCLDFALTETLPVRSMTLVEPPLFVLLRDDPEYGEWFRQFEEIAERANNMRLEEWLPRWMSLMDTRMASELRRDSPVWRIVEKQAPLIFKEEAGWQYDPDPIRLARIDTPSLVINGDLSEPPMQEIGRRLAEVLPKTIHRWIRGAGHDPHARNAGEFNDLLLGFLLTRRG